MPLSTRAVRRIRAAGDSKAIKHCFVKSTLTACLRRPISRKNEDGDEFVAKDLRQQGDGIKRDGQTSPVRDHCPIVGRAVDFARDATRRDPVWWGRGFCFISR